MAAVSNKDVAISTLLQDTPREESPCDLETDQQKDLRRIRQFLEFGILPADDAAARSLAVQALNFSIVDGILYFVDGKKEDAELQCLNTFSDPSSKTTMLERWLDTFQVPNYTVLSVGNGGGVAYPVQRRTRVLPKLW